MRRKICGMVIGLCMLLLFGIVGEIENGASLWLMLWTVPISAVLFGSGAVGGYFM